jgi:hypothetical protein
MVKTGKSKVIKWFGDNYAENLASLVIDLRTVYKRKGKMGGFYTQFCTWKSKNVQYKRSYFRDPLNDEKAFVEFLLSDEVLIRVFDIESNTKKIEYIPVYNWLIYQLATLLYNGVTGKDFDADPDQNFKLLMKINKESVDEFLDVVAELFIEEVLNKE